jgi:HK97 family phage major capsid protein
MKITSRAVWSILAIIGVFIAQAFGYTASAEELTTGGLMLAGIGEIELKDINDLLQKQGSAFEEFKKANDERLKAIEAKGYAPADLTEKVDRINADLQKFDKELLEIAKKSNRHNVGDGEDNGREEFKSALDQFARKGDLNGLLDIHKKSMNSGSDPDGGFLILPYLDGVIERVVPVVSALARLANTVQIGTQKYVKLTKTSGMAVAWPGAGKTAGESAEPDYAEISIEAHPAEVEPWVDNETLEDAFVDLEADLANEAALAFAEGIGTALISGNGVGKPRGILSYTPVANASYAWGKVGYVVSGKSGAFASVAPADKIIDLQHSLKQQYRGNSTWLMNDAALGAARQLKDGSGVYYLWQPDPSAGFGGRFLGRPVEVDDNMSAIAAGSYSIAYGDFKKAYTVVERTGIKVIRDALTQKGVTKFNFRKRVGGGITNYEAIKLLKFATS